MCEENGNITVASIGKTSRDHSATPDAVQLDGPQDRPQTMRGRGRRRIGGEPAGDVVGTALIACVLAALLASSVAVVSAAREIDIAPKIGDILVFRVGAQVPTEWEFAAVTAADQDPVSCNLRPDVMVSAGGSLVVEERFENKRLYRVHWAGQHTGNGASDCGDTADLLISRSDLQLLINAVGGTGVQHKAYPGF
jgi:hypothetical protein